MDRQDLASALQKIAQNALQLHARQPQPTGASASREQEAMIKTALDTGGGQLGSLLLSLQQQAQLPLLQPQLALLLRQSLPVSQQAQTNAHLASQKDYSSQSQASAKATNAGTSVRAAVPGHGSLVSGSAHPMRVRVTRGASVPPHMQHLLMGQPQGIRMPVSSGVNSGSRQSQSLSSSHRSNQPNAYGQANSDYHHHRGSRSSLPGRPSKRGSRRSYEDGDDEDYEPPSASRTESHDRMSSNAQPSTSTSVWSVDHKHDALAGSYSAAPHAIVTLGKRARQEDIDATDSLDRSKSTIDHTGRGTAIYKGRKTKARGVRGGFKGLELKSRSDLASLHEAAASSLGLASDVDMLNLMIEEDQGVPELTASKGRVTLRHSSWGASTTSNGISNPGSAHSISLMSSFLSTTNAIASPPSSAPLSSEAVAGLRTAKKLEAEGSLESQELSRACDDTLIATLTQMQRDGVLQGCDPQIAMKLIRNSLGDASTVESEISNSKSTGRMLHVSLAGTSLLSPLAGLHIGLEHDRSSAVSAHGANESLGNMFKPVRDLVTSGSIHSPVAALPSSRPSTAAVPMSRPSTAGTDGGSRPLSAGGNRASSGNKKPRIIYRTLLATPAPTPSHGNRNAPLASHSSNSQNASGVFAEAFRLNLSTPASSLVSAVEQAANHAATSLVELPVSDRLSLLFLRGNLGSPSAELFVRPSSVDQPPVIPGSEFHTPMGLLPRNDTSFSSTAALLASLTQSNQYAPLTTAHDTFTDIASSLPSTNGTKHLSSAIMTARSSTQSTNTLLNSIGEIQHQHDLSSPGSCRLGLANESSSLMLSQKLLHLQEDPGRDSHNLPVHSPHRPEYTLAHLPVDPMTHSEAVLGFSDQRSFGIRGVDRQSRETSNSNGSGLSPQGSIFSFHTKSTI